MPELAPQPPPTQEPLARLVSPIARKHRPLSELEDRLARIDPAAPLPDRVARLGRLGRWICGGALDVIRAGLQDARFSMLVEALRQWPELRRRFVDSLAGVLAETSGLRLFADVGLHNDRGLLHETTDRLARRFLPAPPDHGDLASLVGEVFRRPRDAAWLADAPLEALSELAALCGDIWAPVKAAMTDAIALLATRISALGLSEDIRARGEPGPVRDSPFFLLPRAPAGELPAILQMCRLHIAMVHEHLESRGVSVDVVYCLDAISLGLDRIEAILPLLSEQLPVERRLLAARALLARVAAAKTEDRSLRGLVRSNLRLMARKVIERAGQSGEHYVTASRREYWVMMASAAGGGFITAFTCVAKYLVKQAHFAPFMDGFLASVNYGASFVIMQLVGFTLATKQPSMTAAALAGSIREASGAGRLDDLVGLIARITRSQLAAAVGNIFMVIPSAIALNFIYKATSGHDFLEAGTARHTIESFDPLTTGTIFYAALTGVLLWLSSLAAGWLENWAVYRRLPEAIEHHPLGRVVGRERMARAGRFFGRHISGLGGNVSLGFLLGMTPAIGAFFGPKLEVRHVTLATGSLTLAVCSLGTGSLQTAAFVWAAIGIVIIALLNFGVSFALALAVAFRARGVSQGERLHLLGAVLRRFVRSPREFFMPPRDAAPSAASSGGAAH